MKKLFNPLVRKVVRSRFGWILCSGLIRLSEWFRFERSIYTRGISIRRLTSFFADMTVRDGYFRGLKYPGLQSFGSALFPKLSGSYESELYPVLYKFRERNYTHIVDIGCAEGYYAVGLALQYPQASVWAFDISEKARQLCRQMSELNGAGERIIISGECTNDFFMSLDAGAYGLIICDIEGFERELFCQQNITALKRFDLIIELHPMYKRDVKEYLSTLFGQTHVVSFVSSQNNERKLYDLDSGYSFMSAEEKLMLVEEGRQFTMEWLIAEAKL